jgi:hypothetical protein
VPWRDASGRKISASSPEPLTISGAGSGNIGVIRNLSGSNSLTGAITLAADSQVNVDSGTLTIASPGSINGAFSLPNTPLVPALLTLEPPSRSRWPARFMTSSSG